VCSVKYFEVIEIVDDNQPYLALMGLEWAFDNKSIINLKRREMIFEVGELKVTAPLDAKEGRRYIEPTKGDEIENLYNIIVRINDYVNPTTESALSWRSISSCTLESEAGMENWQQRMHEVSTW
jgi:hypothetical protein